MERRAELIPINKSITLINDKDDSTYYLVRGRKRALMIDTGNGIEDVMKIAREITDLPIDVVNTHGHCDHVYGNIFCKEAWMHPDDFPICEEHFKRFTKDSNGKNVKCCTLHPLSQGMLFDLGELELEVIEMKGHTPGSIGLIDNKHRILFSGDAVNPCIWLQLQESLSIADYVKSIKDVMKNYGDEFDYHLSGHTKKLIPKKAIYELLNACDEILAGKTAQDKDYKWIGGVHQGHLYGEDGMICYNKNKIY